jgi:hypothetical protein
MSSAWGWVGLTLTGQCYVSSSTKPTTVVCTGMNFHIVGGYVGILNMWSVLFSHLVLYGLFLVYPQCCESDHGVPQIMGHKECPWWSIVILD